MFLLFRLLDYLTPHFLVMYHGLCYPIYLKSSHSHVALSLPPTRKLAFKPTSLLCNNIVQAFKMESHFLNVKDNSVVFFIPQK